VPRSFRFLTLAVLVGLCLTAAAAPAMAVRPGADLALGDQTDQPDPAYPGQLITYSGGFANAGPDVATDVRLQVTLPAGLRFQPASSSSNCSLTGSIVTCYYASWPANAASGPDDPTIAVTATAAGTYDLVFTISANERDRNTANNTETETTTVVQPTEADISLQLDSAEAREGEPFFYGFLVFNAGPAEATNVVVTLELPAGIDYLSGGCTSSGSTVTCGPAEIPPGAGIGAVLQLRATDSGTYTISGNVSADQPDPNPANDADTGTIVVASGDADLSIDVPESTTARVGDTFSFPVSVTNAGPADATSVTATIALPEGIAYASGGCTAAGRYVTCAFGSLPAGVAVETLIQLSAASAGTYAVTATVDGDQEDPVSANNTDTGEVIATAVADVSISIADSLDPVKPGQGVTYTATVVNGGPSPATGVTLSETWSTTSSPGIGVVSWATSQGTCTQTDVRLDCQLGTLASGARLTVFVTLRPRGTGVVTVTATAGATEFDPDPADNTASEATTVGPR
jgi:uncharacterized repeat protein (TIGR01451 family)